MLLLFLIMSSLVFKREKAQDCMVSIKKGEADLLFTSNDYALTPDVTADTLILGILTFATKIST